MISLTDNAAIHLQKLLREQNAADGSGLRILIEKGGCAGWQYTMKVDQPSDQDQIYNHLGVSLIIDPESAVFLKDSRIDYVDALNDSGFRVENPNAARNCGCGTSFEPKSA